MDLLLDEYLAETDPRLTHINVGSGADCSIAELASNVCEVTNFKGGIVYGTSKADGAPRKLMDSSKLPRLGWAPQYSLKQGLEDAYDWYVENIGTARS